MLKNLTVRSKLILILLVPLIALSALAAADAMHRYTTIQSMEKLSNMVNIVASSGAVIHELQKERGNSAGFLGSEGALFSTELAQQRAFSKTALEIFSRTLAAFTALYPADKLGHEFSRIHRQLQSIEEFQTRVSAMDVKPAEAIAYYTKLIESLQAGLEYFLENCPNATLYGHTVNYIALVKGKEYAGQERATLNAALAAGKFTPTLYKAWLERVVLHNEYMDTFFQHIDRTHKDEILQQTGALQKTTQKFRDDAFASVDAPVLTGNAQQWFTASTAYINELHTVEVSVAKALQTTVVRMKSAAQESLSTLLASLAAVFVVTFLASGAIVRDITVSLRTTVLFSQKVAEGQVDTSLDLRRGDEFGTLTSAINTMVQSLKTMLTRAEQANQTAQDETLKAQAATAQAEEATLRAESARQEGMQAAARQLESVVTVLSTASAALAALIQEAQAGADEQSAQMGNTATAMEEMNATVLEVAKNSAHAADSAFSARQQANKGANIVNTVIDNIMTVQGTTRELTTGMAALGVRVQEIGNVLNVISDIADQTNLLALNAAIEAARAGDAGRGFAVVADEVRKLAEKTMTATREVATVIEGIQKDTVRNIGIVESTVAGMDNTTANARESGQTLHEIVTLVDLNSDQIRSIATASEEQSATSEEINRSIGDVNTIACTTTENMQRSSQAVNELRQQVQVLQKLIATLQSSK